MPGFSARRDDDARRVQPAGAVEVTISAEKFPGQLKIPDVMWLALLG